MSAGEQKNVYQISVALFFAGHEIEDADAWFSDLLDENPDVVCTGWTTFEADDPSERDDILACIADQLEGPE